MLPEPVHPPANAVRSEKITTQTIGSEEYRILYEVTAEKKLALQNLQKLLQKKEAAIEQLIFNTLNETEKNCLLAAAKKRELLFRHKSLEDFIKREITINHYFLPILRIRETNLRVLKETTTNVLTKLLAARGTSDVMEANKKFELALRHNELKAGEKGYVYRPPSKLQILHDYSCDLATINKLQSFKLEGTLNVLLAEYRVLTAEFEQKMSAACTRQLFKVSDGSIWKEVSDTPLYKSGTLSYEDKNKKVQLFYADAQILSGREENLQNGAFTITKYSKEGRLFSQKKYETLNGLTRLTSLTTYNPDGSVDTSAKLQGDTLTYYGPEERPLAVLKYSPEGRLISRMMYDNKGRLYGTYQVELQRNPQLSMHEYRQFLRENLTSPEQKHHFIKLLFHYVKDGPGASYIQSPYDSMRRDFNGAMKGNCLDIAWFHKDLFDLQGEKSAVVSIGGRVHAICLRIFNKNGRYFAETFCNFGYDINGCRYGHEKNNERMAGAESPEEALNWVLEKYKDIRRLKTDNLTDGFELTAINRDPDKEGQIGNKHYYLVGLRELVSKKNNERNKIAHSF